MSYSQVLLTEHGKEALQESIMNDKEIQFTNIRTSSGIYELEDVENLTKLENIQQTSSIESQVRIDNVNYQVASTFKNDKTDTAYGIQTIGIYIEGELPVEPQPLLDEEGNPILDDNGEIVYDEIPEVELIPVEDENGDPVLDDEGQPTYHEPPLAEILYGVAIATEPFYMAPSRLNQTSLNLKLKVNVSSANVANLVVNPIGSASIEDLQQVRDIVIEAEMSSAKNSVESLELMSAINEMQAISQANLNAEMLELIMTMGLGGM